METLQDIIWVAKEYQSMGWAVQEQLDALLDGEDVEAQNPNALAMVLGERADAIVVRNGSERAEISAENGIPAGTRAASVLNVPSLGLTMISAKPAASNPSQ